jgi:hypothetical protein
MNSTHPLKVDWTSFDKCYSDEVSTWPEAIQLIDKIESHSSVPCIVEFYHSTSGQAFSFGIGRKSTVATYQDSLAPPYFISVGDPNATGVQWFCFGNEETEYLESNLIDNSIAIQALENFIKSRKKPSNINWETL